jgi:quercetin dioxygenase-like cupin family protein
MKRTLLFVSLQAMASLLAMRCSLFAQSVNPASPSSAAAPKATPLLLEKDDGEIWTRRPRPVRTPASQIMLKVSPHSNGSEHLVLGTETLEINGTVPTHKHLGQDEILLINTGTVHARVGDQERDLHAGGLIFVPADTWVGLKNTSQESVNITFIFSAPGFDEYVRCTSVPASVKSTPMTQEEWEHCQHDANAVFKRAP